MIYDDGWPDEVREEWERNDEIRKELEAKVGPVSDLLWGALESNIEGYWDEYLVEGDIGVLVKAVRKERPQDDRPAPRPRAIRRSEVGPDERLRYLSRILAVEAASITNVKDFREKHLPRGLLEPGEVSNWIEQKRKEEGSHSVMFGVPVRFELLDRAADSFDSVQNLFGALSKLPKDALEGLAAEVSFIELQTPVPVPITKDVRISSVPISHEGTLYELKKAAQAVSGLYGWREREAVGFILTGITPDIPKARITIPNPIAAELHPTPRIVLELDPRLSSEEVKDIYAKARSQVFKGRDRKMKKKNLELALFLVNNPSHTWRDMASLWNDTCPDPKWKYERWENFSRDARAAYQRVRGKKWIHKGPDQRKEA